MVSTDRPTRTISTSRPISAAAEQISELARLLRRVGVLRAQGDAARGVSLEAIEISALVREIREQHGPDALSEDQLQAMRATEERRVAEAGILAELLIPRLVVALPAMAEPGRSIPARSMAEPAARPLMAGPPAISDMLDAMLAAERTSRRPTPAIHRES